MESPGGFRGPFGPGASERQRRDQESPPERPEELPFDPEAPREHYARSHHFAVNPRACASCRVPIEEHEEFLVVAAVGVMHANCGLAPNVRQPKLFGAGSRGPDVGRRERDAVSAAPPYPSHPERHWFEQGYSEWFEALDLIAPGASALPGAYEAWNRGLTPEEFLQEAGHVLAPNPKQSALRKRLMKQLGGARYVWEGDESVHYSRTGVRTVLETRKPTPTPPMYYVRFAHGELGPFESVEEARAMGQSVASDYKVVAYHGMSARQVWP